MDVLSRRALKGQILLFLALAAMTFGPARTLAYWQAWVFLAIWFATSLAVTLYLLKHDRALLERRMGAGPVAEKEPVQKIIMAIASLGFTVVTLVPGFDCHYHWSHMPTAIVLAGDALVMLGWLAIFFVFRENSFTSATIELAPDQTVISTGPYALVRHPMYVGGLVMLLGIPIALGSWWAVLGFAVIGPAVAWRLVEEEKFLVRNLAGYEAYRSRVRYRLVPFVW
jgi:protein-S-isoprenylcysteine O-methyltransferase Ste14